jgi:hypothetical protein
LTLYKLKITGRREGKAISANFGGVRELTAMDNYSFVGVIYTYRSLFKRLTEIISFICENTMKRI